MASKTSSIEPEKAIVDMAELGMRLAARRKVAGIPHLPRNAGADRKPCKQALLHELAKTGADW